MSNPSKSPATLTASPVLTESLDAMRAPIAALAQESLSNRRNQLLVVAEFQLVNRTIGPPYQRFGPGTLGLLLNL